GLAALGEAGELGVADRAGGAARAPDVLEGVVAALDQALDARRRLGDRGVVAVEARRVPADGAGRVGVGPVEDDALVVGVVGILLGQVLEVPPVARDLAQAVVGGDVAEEAGAAAATVGAAAAARVEQAAAGCHLHVAPADVAVDLLAQGAADG